LSLTILINVGRLRPWCCKEKEDFSGNRKASTEAGLKPACVYLLLCAGSFLSSIDCLLKPEESE